MLSLMPSKSSPLHYAASFNRTDALQLLIDHGANINKKSRVGYTPLRCAVGKIHIDAVQLLIDHRADINATDIEGRTPMRHAFSMLCGYWYDDVVRMMRLFTAHSGHR